MIRECLNSTIEVANEMLRLEEILIEKLYSVDRERFYVKYGYKSLSGFCEKALRISKTQTQRIVTQVRRSEPTANIMDGRRHDMGPRTLKELRAKKYN